jgi:hypothetical protein
VQTGGIADARAVYANGNQGLYEDALGRLLGREIAAATMSG